jgi:uncharacterized protein (TIGR02118 family)
VAKIVVLYKTPKNAAAFDRYYFETHAPIAKKIPGLRKYDVTAGAITTPAGPSPVHLIATLTFDSMAAIQSALGSPGGQAAVADLANFADGGVDIYFHETKEL